MNIQKIILVGAATFLLSFVVKATPIPINITMSFPLDSSSVLVSDIDAGDLSSYGPGLSPAADLGWLEADVSQYDHNLGMSLVVAPVDQSGTGEGLTDVTVAAGDYLVLHYGKGDGGKGKGGGVVALYFATAGTYDVPQLGSGPNGVGGISYVNLFTGATTSSVPDGGLTMSMLGASITGIAILNRRIKK